MPANTAWCKVEAIGGGGAGAGETTTGVGGGGGGGEYAREDVFACVAGHVIPYSVGAGGTAGATPVAGAPTFFGPGPPARWWSGERRACPRRRTASPGRCAPPGPPTPSTTRAGRAAPPAAPWAAAAGHSAGTGSARPHPDGDRRRPVHRRRVEQLDLPGRGHAGLRRMLGRRRVRRHRVRVRQRRRRRRRRIRGAVHRRHARPPSTTPFVGTGGAAASGTAPTATPGPPRRSPGTRQTVTANPGGGGLFETFTDGQGAAGTGSGERGALRRRQGRPGVPLLRRRRVLRRVQRLRQRRGRIRRRRCRAVRRRKRRRRIGSEQQPRHGRDRAGRRRRRHLQQRHLRRRRRTGKCGSPTPAGRPPTTALRRWPGAARAARAAGRPTRPGRPDPSRAAAAAEPTPPAPPRQAARAAPGRLIITPVLQRGVQEPDRAPAAARRGQDLPAARRRRRRVRRPRRHARVPHAPAPDRRERGLPGDLHRLPRRVVAVRRREPRRSASPSTSTSTPAARSTACPPCRSRSRPRRSPTGSSPPGS